MGKLKSELTWSFSRDRLFKQCRRAYFYHYYASWGGWEAGADQLCRKAYILKNMRNIDAWIGDIIHQIIRWILQQRVNTAQTIFKKDEGISCEKALKTAKNLLLKTWEQSRSRKWEENLKQNLNLFEHYYNRELTRNQLRVKLEKVDKSLKNFYQSGLFAELSKLPAESFLTIDELDSFNFEGTRIFAIPDFALLSGGQYRLYDWKTGKRSDDDILQLSCYGIYAMDKWLVSAEQIKIIPVYLNQDNFSLVPAKPIPSQELKNYIRTSIRTMRESLKDPVTNRADIIDFPKTDDTKRCQRCKFQEICS